jgi:hypothetical protein
VSALARAVLGLLCLWLGGCAALPWPSGRTRSAAEQRVGEWLDLRGAVHVHTRASHDSPGRIDALIDAAHAAGIRWIAFTEHTRHARFAPARGRIEGVTLIPGWELSAAGGSILALGIEEARDLPREPRALVAAIHARGGAAFVAHMERSALVDPERWAGLGADGLELANLHAAADAARLRVAFAQLLLPARFALRVLLAPPQRNLELWARLPEARAIVGGVDAHQKFRALGPLGGTVDRYRDLLRMLTTHVLARDDSPAAILEALRAGRSYLAFEGLAPVDRFEVEVGRAGVAVRAPRAARMALVCAGETIDGAEGSSVRLRARPGATHCHVQAWLGSRLWIATSQLEVAW